MSTHYQRKMMQKSWEWHAKDVKHVEPLRWYTGNQLWYAMGCAFVAGLVVAVILTEISK